MRDPGLLFQVPQIRRAPGLTQDLARLGYAIGSSSAELQRSARQPRPPMNTLLLGIAGRPVSPDHQVLRGTTDPRFATDHGHVDRF